MLAAWVEKNLSQFIHCLKHNFEKYKGQVFDENSGSGQCVKHNAHHWPIDIDNNITKIHNTTTSLKLTYHD